MDENLHYLEDRFVPLGKVTGATGVAAPVIHEFIDDRLIPRACYFPGSDGMLASNLGSTATKLDTMWFHPSAIMWIGDTEALLQSGVRADALSAQRRRWFKAGYLRHLQDLHDIGLIETAVWDEAFPDETRRVAIANSEFEHWIAGTYGLCTRANTPEAVAVKECMVRNIDYLTHNGEAARLDDHSRKKVERYVRLFDHVAALFAPFERMNSSRHRLCRRIPERYGLDVPATRQHAAP